MADILDAAQSNTPASPASPNRGEPVGGQPSSGTPPPVTEPVPAVPMEPAPPPASEPVEPPATSTDSLIIPPPEVPAPEPTPPAAEPPPEKPKKKSRLGVLLAGLLLLVITLPILVVFVRQQIEIRSRAVGCASPNFCVASAAICRGEGGHVVTGTCTNIVYVCCSLTYPTATPTQTTTPGPTCGPDGSCKPSAVSCCHSSQSDVTCATGIRCIAAPPTPTCQSPNECLSVSICANYGTQVEGTCTGGTVCCSRACQSPNECLSTSICANYGTHVDGTCPSGYVCCNTSPTPTPTPSSPAGKSCTTIRGWPGTCTLGSNCNNELPGIAWDYNVATCKVPTTTSTYGCCGIDKSVSCTAGGRTGYCANAFTCTDPNSELLDLGTQQSQCPEGKVKCCVPAKTLCSGGNTRVGTNASACLAGETYAGPSQKAGYVCCMPAATLCSGGNTRVGTNASACLAGETYAGPSQKAGYVCCMPAANCAGPCLITSCLSAGMCSDTTGTCTGTNAGRNCCKSCTPTTTPPPGGCNGPCLMTSCLSAGMCDDATGTCTVANAGRSCCKSCTPTTPTCVSPNTCLLNWTECSDAGGTQVGTKTCANNWKCCYIPVPTCPSDFTPWGSCNSQYSGKGCICTSAKGIKYECKQNSSGPPYVWAPCGGTTTCPWQLTNGKCCPTSPDACATLGDKICVGDPFISICSVWDLSCPVGHQYYWKHLENVTSCDNITPTPTPTSPPPQCINIVAYKDGNALSASELAALHPGDTITLAFAPGGAATKVHFRVNAGNWNETTTKNANSQFIWNYTLANVTSFTIEAQWFDGTAWH